MPKGPIREIDTFAYNLENMKSKFLLRKGLAVFIVATLIWVAPGTGLYEALANMGTMPVSARAPLGASHLGGAAGGTKEI